jgi:hypothetical protein
VRVIFKAIFSKQIKAREAQAGPSQNVGANVKPEDETEAIENVLKRIDEIKEEFLEEQKRKNQSN